MPWQFCENGNSCGRNQIYLNFVLWWRHADSYNYWWEKKNIDRPFWQQQQQIKLDKWNSSLNDWEKARSRTWKTFRGKTFKQRTGKLVEKDKQNETEEKGMSLQLQAFHHEQRIIEQVVVKLGWLWLNILSETSERAGYRRAHRGWIKYNVSLASLRYL